MGDGRRKEKEDIYMLRRDVLGKEVKVWSSWL
jgi:hypothetical protein